MTEKYRYEGWVSEESAQRINYHSALITDEDGEVVFDTDDPGTVWVKAVIHDYEPYHYGRYWEYPSPSFECALLWIPNFMYCLGDTYQMTLWKDDFKFDFPRIEYNKDYHDLVTIADENGSHYWYRKQAAA